MSTKIKNYFSTYKDSLARMYTDYTNKKRAKIMVKLVNAGEFSKTSYEDLRVKLGFTKKTLLERILK